jgi:phospholipase/carboxylesterase
MLSYEHDFPVNVQAGADLIVLLHGRGSHMGDLMGLRPYLPADAMVVAPQAPFSGMKWGYGPGWAWYRFLGEGRPEPESFESSQAQLRSFLTTDLPDQLPVKPGRLILGGFSQGAVTSMAYALRNPGEVDSVLSFSGFLAKHPSVQATPESVKGTRFWWGHGTQDPMISFELALEGWAALTAAGANLTTGQYSMGHSIDGSELRDAVAWLNAKQ